jgi:molecular chaperone GrpE
VLKEMLPVVDNLERAMEHATQGGEVDPKLKGFVEGVQLVLRQFGNAFERLEVQAVDAMDQPFDPNQHEAISQQESDKAPGTVVQVLQRGYKSGDRLLRPALVVVAKAKAQAE